MTNPPNKDVEPFRTFQFEDGKRYPVTNPRMDLPMVPLFTAAQLKEVELRAYERAARVAESAFEEFQQIKDAHERLSPTPFHPGMFGINMSHVDWSRRAADAIRKLVGEV